MATVLQASFSSQFAEKTCPRKLTGNGANLHLDALAYGFSSQSLSRTCRDCCTSSFLLLLRIRMSSTQVDSSLSKYGRMKLFATFVNAASALVRSKRIVFETLTDHTSSGTTCKEQTSGSGESDNIRTEIVKW